MNCRIALLLILAKYYPGNISNILIFMRQRCIHFTVKKNIVFLTTSSKGEGWKGIPIFVIVIQSFFNALGS